MTDVGTAQSQLPHALEPKKFGEAFGHFQKLILARSGHPFTNFHEGLAAVWESYKPRLHEEGVRLLDAATWSESGTGTGVILQHVLDAIEIQDVRRNLSNNLVFWQNRFGHANREHRALLEAKSNPRVLKELELLLFGLYRGDADEGIAFERLRELTDAKYPLLAYLFFLKDMDRFMPIQPTGFDRAFKAMGIDFSTLRHCGWENYTTYNWLLSELRPAIASAAGLKDVSLIDAHSFCWILTTLFKQEAESGLAAPSGKASDGRVLSGRETSIIAMRLSVENTVKNSNGQIVQTTVKNKELRMSSQDLEQLLTELLDVQENRCALTGIPFNFHGSNADKNLLPSLDRKDSDGHYEKGNLQIVCHFINFWKGASNNDDFRALLMLVRGAEAA
jgi:hypothetical protein